LHGGNLSFVLLFAFIEGGKLSVHLTEESLALSFEFVATEALELKLEFEFVCQDLELSFGLSDALF
jgi:hypothetical protein